MQWRKRCSIDLSSRCFWCVEHLTLLLLEYIVGHSSTVVEMDFLVTVHIVVSRPLDLDILYSELSACNSSQHIVDLHCIKVKS